jgi:tetratricopeptide (TPR) repeat protein
MKSPEQFALASASAVSPMPGALTGPVAQGQRETWGKKSIRRGAALKAFVARFDRWLMPVLLLGLCFAAYWPMLPGSMLMDDQKLVELENPLVLGKMSLASIWFQVDFPLSSVGFWIERILFGNNPGWYHAINIALHAISAFLLWRLLVQLKIRGAWLAGIVFAIHPVCVVSVARIAELKNTLSLPFFLVSLWAYFRYEDLSIYSQACVPSPRRQRRATGFYTLSIGCFILALFSKTTTIMLPALLLCCAAWRRNRLSRKDLLHTSAHFVLALGFGLLSVWFQKYQALGGASLGHKSFWERLAVAARAFWFYLGKAFVPTHLTIAYPQWKIETAAVMTYLPVFLALGIFFLCYHYRRGWGRHVLFGLSAFAIALFPALGFFDAQFLTMWQVSDHLQYLPLVASVALGAAVLSSIMPPRVFACGSIVVIFIFSGLTFKRAHSFSTEEALLRETLSNNPAAWAAHNDLGCLLAQQKNYSGAIDHFESSLKANSLNADAHFNLGQIRTLQNRDDEAAAHFVATLRTKPFHAQAHHLYATVLSRHGKPKEAILHLRAAVACSGSPEARMDLSGLLYSGGDVPGAIEQLWKVVANKPTYAEALNNLAWLLATGPEEKFRNGGQAVLCAQRACELTSYHVPGMIGTLAAAYAEAGRYAEAIATAEQAIQVASASGDERFANLNRQFLGLYREKRAWHQSASPRSAG